MGIRNAQIVRLLTRNGMFNSKRGSISSFNSIENTVLMELALSSADYPLDIDAKKKKLLPRTYMHGWRELSKSLGMTIADSLEDLSIIGSEPRNLRKEETARIRISRVIKKLQAKGLVKCLKTGRYSKHNSAIWLLTIGDEDENRECEKYVRRMLNLDNPTPDAQPQPNTSMPKHTAQTITPAASIPPLSRVEPNQALLALLSMPTKTMQQADECDKIEETSLQGEGKEEKVTIQTKNAEVEEFKRTHEGLSPRQYFVKYGHNAPDVQKQTSTPWYDRQ